MSISYGAHLDQIPEQEILYSNLKQYMHIFHLEEAGFYKDLDAYGIVEISQNIEKDHGMAVFYPVAFIFYFNQISPFIGNIVWHIYIFMLCFCGVTAFESLIYDLFEDRTVSRLATCMLFFSPRMFAESHYNNKDMVLLSMILCICWLGRKAYRELSWKWILLFAYVGSLATNMKIVSVFIWGMTGLYILIFLLVEHRFNFPILIKMIVCILLYFLVYILLTPACAPGLTEFLKYLIDSARNFRWNDYLFFKGQLYNKETTGMPADYLPVMMITTIPVVMLILSIVGAVDIIFKIIRKPHKLDAETGYVIL